MKQKEEVLKHKEALKQKEALKPRHVVSKKIEGPVVCKQVNIEKKTEYTHIDIPKNSLKIELKKVNLNCSV